MIDIQRLIETDRTGLRRFWQEQWGEDLMIVHGQAYTTSMLDGFVAVEDGTWLGLLTFIVENSTCEIISLDSLREGQGIGSSLINAVETEARQRGCTRLTVSTTNDNIHALRFYQKRGFFLAALRVRAVEESRKRKPSIPLTGNDGIPIRDELELEMRLE